MDGTAIISYHMTCLTTSRGSITPRSIDPNALPIIDPNYYATEADRSIVREAWRVPSRLMFENPEGKELIGVEILPKGDQCLQSAATEEEIDYTA